MTNNDGGPAFPTDSEHQPQNHVMHFEGMSLRDWFAGQAMKTIIEFEGMDLDATIARQSYELADAMLAAREVER